MGYEITISLQRKLRNKIIEEAYENNCENHYTFYEIEGVRRTIHKNKYMITFIFPENKIGLINFLNLIKKRVKIETIGYNNCIYKTLYSGRGKITDIF